MCLLVKLSVRNVVGIASQAIIIKIVIIIIIIMIIIIIVIIIIIMIIIMIIIIIVIIIIIMIIIMIIIIMIIIIMIIIIMIKVSISMYVLEMYWKRKLYPLCRACAISKTRTLSCHSVHCTLINYDDKYCMQIQSLQVSQINCHNADQCNHTASPALIKSNRF